MEFGFVAIDKMLQPLTVVFKTGKVFEVINRNNLQRPAPIGTLKIIRMFELGITGRTRARKRRV